MKTVFLFLALLVVQMISTAAETYTSDDIQRVLRIKNVPARQDGKHLLVLDRILPDGKLQCRYFGTRQELILEKSATTPSVFYEDSSDFMITQYVLQNCFGNIRNDLPYQLAILKGDKTGRISKLQNLNRVLKNFSQQLIQIRNEFASDRDDQLDAYIVLLDKTDFSELLNSAVAMQDWLLTVALYEKYKSQTTALTSRYLPYKSPQQELRSRLTALEKELVANFARRMQTANIRQEQFKNKYPAAGGLWSRTAPADYAELKFFFVQSMESYMRLDKLSIIFSPQECGSAMLDVLLMTEGSPGAAELENEFDRMIRNLPEKSRNKQQNQNK